jgi:hypothetical protein
MKDGPDDKSPPTDVEENQLDRDFFSGKSMEDLKDQLETGDGEPLDEDAQELDRIMKPARGRARHPVLAGIVMMLSLVLMWMMWEDFVYFFRSRKPVDVGHVVTALHEGRLKDNTYVKIQGSPDLSTKATVTRRGCTLAPKSAPKSFYNFYVMRSSQDRMVVRRSMTWRQKTKAAKRPVIRAEVTGRLRRFKTIKGYFRSFKKFLWQMSAHYPTLRNEHELSRAELERHVGKRKAQLKDKSGQVVSVDVRTKVALYAEFKDQFEVSVSKAYKETLDGVQFQGGNGPTRCGADKKARGGSVVLEKSATVVSLDALRAKKIHRAPDRSAGPPTKPGAKKPELDLVIKVPEAIKVYEKKTGDLLPFEQKRLAVARGGRCGAKGTTAVLNFEALPFQSVKAAEVYVAGLGHPFILVEENPHLYTFVIKAPPAAGGTLKKRQRRGSAYSIDNRTEWYHLRWGELAYHEGVFVIEPARPSHPVDYVAAPAASPARARPGPTRPEGARPGSKQPEDPKSAKAKGKRGAVVPAEAEKKIGRRLRKADVGGQIRIPAARVQYAEITTPRRLPEDAWVLLTGEKPSKLWYYPLIYLLLGGFMVFNVFAIKNYFKARKEAGQGLFG